MTLRTKNTIKTRVYLLRDLLRLIYIYCHQVAVIIVLEYDPVNRNYSLKVSTKIRYRLLSIRKFMTNNKERVSEVRHKFYELKLLSQNLECSVSCIDLCDCHSAKMKAQKY